MTRCIKSHYLELCRRFPEYTDILNYDENFLIVGLYVLLVDVYRASTYFTYIDILAPRFVKYELISSKDNVLDIIESMLKTSNTLISNPDSRLVNLQLPKARQRYTITDLDFLYSRYVYKFLKDDHSLKTDISSSFPYIFVNHVKFPDLDIEIEIIDGHVIVGRLVDDKHTQKYYGEHPFVAYAKLNLCDIDSIKKRITIIVSTYSSNVYY
jgi:hypothetical protein